MSNINLKATEYTPEIILDKQKNLIFIKGNSFPENTFEFYKEIVSWIKAYFKEGGQTPKITIDINYFNSSSSQQFFDIFDIFEEASSDNTIEVQWLYDVNNESAQEAGEDFIEEFESLNIHLIKKT